MIIVSPLLVPVWIAGLVAPWRGTTLRPVRFLSFTYVALAVLYLAGDGKAYYLASLYPAVLGIAAIPVAAWTERYPIRDGRVAGRSHSARTGVLVGAVAVSAVINALIALPLLPATALRASPIIAANPDQAETVGWPDFVRAVADSWRSIPPAERSHAVIFTHNYGEAGAIDLLGPGRGLPGAYSGHNGYSRWGQPPAGASPVLVVGYGADAAAPYFIDCVTAAHVDNAARLDNDERGLPILVCRPARPWSRMWPALTHYG